MIIVPKVSQRLWLTMVLDYLRGATGGANPLFAVKLYVNDFAPNLDTVLGDFTEANFPGYAAKFVGDQFAFPVTNGDGFAQSTGPVLAWTPTDNTSNQTVHGWYATFQTDLVPALLWCGERLVPGVQVNQPGAVVRIRPRPTLGSRFAS